MRSSKPKLTTSPLDYFEHVERKGGSKIVQLDVIEWEEPTTEPIVVEESSDLWLIAKAKLLWKNHIKESNK